MWQKGLQSALGITKCGRVGYKVRQGLQSVAELQSKLVHIDCESEDYTISCALFKWDI